MPLRLLLDENLRHEAIWRAIEQHPPAGVQRIDVVRVGDSNAPPLSSTDAELLEWAAVENRVLVSLDVGTLADALASLGRESPGAIILRRGLSALDVAALLELVAHNSTAEEWRNACKWLP